jgi:hypothetical protein
MKHTPRETEVPLNSRAAELLEGASFYDAWRINSARVDWSALEHFLAAAATTPRWVNTALNARNFVADEIYRSFDADDQIQLYAHKTKEYTDAE